MRNGEAENLCNSPVDCLLLAFYCSHFYFSLQIHATPEKDICATCLWLADVFVLRQTLINPIFSVCLSRISSNGFHKRSIFFAPFPLHHHHHHHAIINCKRSERLQFSPRADDDDSVMLLFYDAKRNLSAREMNCMSCNDTQ